MRAKLEALADTVQMFYTKRMADELRDAAKGFEVLAERKFDYSDVPVYRLFSTPGHMRLLRT